MSFKNKKQQNSMHVAYPDITLEWISKTNFSDITETVDEKVDLKQLRNPVEFINGVDQFVKDTKADVNMLQHFSDTYAQSVVDKPEVKKIAAGIKMSLPNLIRDLDMLDNSVKQLKTMDLTKSARLPGVTDQPPQKRGLMSKLFGKK